MNPALQRKLLFVGACAGMLVFGIVLAMLGTVFGMPEMHMRLRISLAQQGDLILLLYLGIFLASLLVGPLIDHLGNRINLILSSVFVALAMLLFSSAHSFRMAALAAIVLGFGGGGLNTCTNALVSDVYGDNRGPMLNLLGIFFGIGALCVPMLAASLEGSFTIPQLLVFCATLAGFCALLYVLIRFPRAKATQAFSWRETLGVAAYPGVLLLAFILCFEAGNEACVAGWTSTYANTSGFAPKIATFILAGYWAALMLGRVIAASLLQVMSKISVTATCAIISVTGTLILLTARSLVMLVLGITLIGLSYGPIFPTTLAIAGDRYTREAGTVFGLLFSIALLGGMIFPWAVGRISEQFSVRTGMLVPLLGAAGICTLSGKLMAEMRRGQGSNSTTAKT